MRTQQHLTRIAINQRTAPVKQPICAGVFLGKKCIYENVNFALCQEYKRVNCPKGIVKYVFR